MAWTAPSGHVWATGEVVTAANMNTYIANNLSFLQNFSTNYVATASSTNNIGAYGDIGAAGPTVTLTTGTTALVIMSSSIYNTVDGDGAIIAYTISGATTQAAFDASSCAVASPAASVGHRAGATFMQTGLTAGSNTFTMKYKCLTGGVANFQDRFISVVALPS